VTRSPASMRLRSDSLTAKEFRVIIFI